jgi:hypothetical protein
MGVQGVSARMLRTGPTVRGSLSQQRLTALLSGSAAYTCDELMRVANDLNVNPVWLLVGNHSYKCECQRLRENLVPVVREMAALLQSDLTPWADESATTSPRRGRKR